MIIKQDGPTGQVCERHMCDSKLKHLDNPFIDSSQRQTVVDMKGKLKQNGILYFRLWIKLFWYLLDVMVLNDIIEQAAGRQSGASGDHGGKSLKSFQNKNNFNSLFNIKTKIKLLHK